MTDRDPELMQALWEAGKAAARHLGLGEPEYMTICGKGERMAMSENPRNTQFRGFAELLAAEIANTDGWQLQDVEKLIARRAYDLARHVLHSFELADLETCDGRDELLLDIPDMMEWPKEEG